MKRADIKVGEVYGVRYGNFSTRYSIAEPVPARVISLDATCTAKVSGRYERELVGGIEVEFVKPTRVGNSYMGFSLAAKTNENAGKVAKRFVFHDQRYGCGGSVGKCFVGLWADLERDRKDEARAERETEALYRRKAEDFKPVLAAYVERLQKIGLPVELYADGSGMHGAVDVDLYRGDHGAYELGYHTRMPRVVFDQLVEIAERHGETVDPDRSDP